MLDRSIPVMVRIRTMYSNETRFVQAAFSTRASGVSNRDLTEAQAREGQLTCGLRRS